MAAVPAPIALNNCLCNLPRGDFSEFTPPYPADSCEATPVTTKSFCCPEAYAIIGPVIEAIGLFRMGFFCAFAVIQKSLITGGTLR